MRGVAALILAFASVAVHAAGPDDDGVGFTGMYVSLCMKHFTDLDAFHAKLLRDQVPKLPPHDARLFTGKVEGEAWPVPYKGQMGNFVLAIAAKKNLCMVHARRTNPAEVEKKFIAMVSEAPKPLVVKRGKPVVKGRTRTVVYTWAKPGARRKMQFTLRTDASPNAPLQAVGTVATVAD
ncbi:hypothetical protein IA69_05770 [Massilia sp. JS1662]|nr:hypothetical protein [Massilia sp. JS1662]KGF82774.1 hypothetical protein IA69_05770 [Massilia sp. JS1662]